MRNLGRLLLGVGVAALIFAGVHVYDIIKLATAYDLVAEVPVTVGAKTSTGTLEVRTEKACQIGVRVELTTESVSEDEDEEGEIEYEPQYRFPVTYRALDGSGETVHSEKTAVDWESGTKSTSSSRVSASSASVTVESYFEKFDVEPPGEIAVEITVEPDVTYRAEAGSVKLRVYDNVERIPGGLIAKAVAFGVAGIVLLGVGAFMAARPGTPRPSEPPSA